jgi:signal transduction histidine kinase
MGAGQQVGIYQLAENQLLQKLPVSGSPVRRIWPFSPDGTYLAVTYDDSQTRIWNLRSGRVTLILQLDAGLAQTLDFSPDSQVLATAESDGAIRLHRLADLLRPEEIQMNLGGQLQLRFSADGKLLGIFSENSSEVALVQAAGGKTVARLRHPHVVRGLGWHPSLPIVATACGDHNGYVWNVNEPQRPLAILTGHQSSLVHVEFHPQAELLLSTSWDGSVRLWDAATSREIARTALPSYGARFSGNGRWVASYKDAALASLNLYEVSTRRAVTFLHADETDADAERAKRLGYASWEVNFSPDEQWLVSAGKQGVKLWDLQRGGVVPLLASECFSAFFDAGGQQIIASGLEGLMRWRIEGGSLERPPHFSGPERLGAADACERAAASRSSTLIAYARAGAVHVLGQDRSFKGWPAYQWVAVSPNARWIAASAWGQAAVRAWDAATGELVHEFPTRNTADLAFSADSQCLMTGGPDEYCLWDMDTGEVKRRLPRTGEPEFHGMIAFSADQRRVAVVRSLTQVQLLDAQTFEELGRLESPVPQFIAWLAFSPSGQQLAVATETPFIQLWDLAFAEHELARLGLGWDQQFASGRHEDSVPANPPALATQTASFSRNLAPGRRSNAFPVLTLGAVALVIYLAVSVLQRQRRLVQSYQQLDELAARRRLELQATQTELLVSQKMRALGTLAAGIAHDFNNLLSIIRLSNDLIARESRGRPEIAEEVEAIENAVQQGKEVVRSMLGYSRDKPEEPAPYLVADVIAETVSLLSKEFLSGIVLNLDVDKNGPPIYGRRSRLEQILLNLIVNAAEAMHGQGKLSISVGVRYGIPTPGLVLQPAAGARFFEISVTDSGPGIEPQILIRIFEPFFTTKTEGTARGTGLGLSLVYTIAQQDGFGLGVETVLGQGTTFRILVPAPPEGVDSDVV